MFKNKDKKSYNAGKKKALSEIETAVVGTSSFCTQEECDSFDKISGYKTKDLEVIMDASYKDGVLGFAALLKCSHVKIILQDSFVNEMDVEVNGTYSGAYAEMVGLIKIIKYLDRSGILSLDKTISIGCDNKIAIMHMKNIIDGSFTSKKGNSSAIRQLVKVNEFYFSKLSGKTKIKFIDVNSKARKGVRGRNPYHFVMDTLASTAVGAKVKDNSKFLNHYDAETLELVDKGSLKNGVLYFLSANKFLVDKSMLNDDSRSSVLYTDKETFEELQRMLIEKSKMKRFVFRKASNLGKREVYKLYRAALDCTSVILER